MMAKRTRPWDNDFERQKKILVSEKKLYSSNSDYMNSVYDKTSRMLFQGANQFKNSALDLKLREEFKQEEMELVVAFPSTDKTQSKVTTGKSELEESLCHSEIEEQINVSNILDKDLLSSVDYDWNARGWREISDEIDLNSSSSCDSVATLVNETAYEKDVEEIKNQDKIRPPSPYPTFEEDSMFRRIMDSNKKRLHYLEMKQKEISRLATLENNGALLNLSSQPSGGQCSAMPNKSKLYKQTRLDELSFTLDGLSVEKQAAIKEQQTDKGFR